jgi:pseudaminic acid biosynthesis-associated methylase
MTDHAASPSETARLEHLWTGDFGDAYVERNAAAVDSRRPFWTGLLDRFRSRRILEVGCAHGENLRHLAAVTGAPRSVWGTDINERALRAVAEVAPGTNAVWAPARELPFRDGWFDLVFTVGLLIHIPEESLPLVMGEIVRTTRRWLLWGEYHSDEPTDVNYRGEPGVLLKRDFGARYARLFPDLVLREEGFLTADDGFDRVTYQVLERV